MKVINADLGAFLKRNELLEIRVFFKGGRFYAVTPSVEQHATSLDAALEHVAEEYRRRANSMEPMRDNGAGKPGDCAKAPTPATTTFSPPACPQNIKFNVSHQPAPPPPKINGAVPSCPTCGYLPDYMTGNGSDLVICKNFHTWPATDGQTYLFTSGERFTFSANGMWITGKWVKQP